MSKYLKPVWKTSNMSRGRYKYWKILKNKKKNPATTAVFFHTLYAVIHNPSCSHMFNISRPFFVLEEDTVNKVLLLPSSAHKSAGPRPHPLFVVSTLSDTPMITTTALTVWMRDESYFPYCRDVINLWKKNPKKRTGWGPFYGQNVLYTCSHTKYACKGFCFAQ